MRKFNVLFTFFAVAALLCCTAPASASVIVNLQTGACGTFPVSNNDLIEAGQPSLASVVLTSGEAKWGSDVSKLVDGSVYGGSTFTDTAQTLTPADGSVVTVTLDTTTNTLGYNISSIVSTAAMDLFGGYSRASQKYDVAYSTVSAPSTWVNLSGDAGATVNRLADTSPESQVTVTSGSAAPIATGVKALKFTFHDLGYYPQNEYREIDVVGSAVPEPSTFVLLALAGLGLAWIKRKS
jgi:hypothetical protein